MESLFEVQKNIEEKLSQLESVAKEFTTRYRTSETEVDRFAQVESLSNLRSENSKLRYQIDILKENVENITKLAKEMCISMGIADSSNENSKLMQSIYKELTSIFECAITKAFPSLSSAPVILQRSDFADYQCNSALKLTKMLTEKKNPVEIAKQIIANLQQNNLIQNVTVSGPGFINITVKDEFVKEQLLNIIIHGVQIRLADPTKQERIIVDYSSPNIAKEMHVGHLRSTIIGDSIARLFEFVGYPILRLNHIGDWGTQFGMLLAHLMDKFPDYKSTPPPIADLQLFYKESKKRFDEDPEFKQKAYETTVRLQLKEPDIIQAWQLICDISRAEFNKMYRILNVSPELIERGESFYHDYMKDIVEDLTQRNLLVEEDGRKVFYSSDKSLPPLTIVKSDGGFTYDTSDLSAIRQRVQQEKATRIIYTVDAGQSTHFQTFFDCARIAGYYDPAKTRVDHLSFGVVLGEDKKKFKTRSGETVRLKDLVKEGMERSLEKLVEKGRDKVLTEEELKAAQEAVAIGCIKYADLSHDRNHDYVFSFDRMLDDRGNTAVYLLYALTRIRSIVRNAELTESVTKIGSQLKENNTLELKHPREIKLAKYILNFTDVIVQIVDDLYLHSLCKYLYELSVIFSEFYDQCYVIEKINEQEKKVNLSRIVLCEATARIMETGLFILGIKTVEKM